MTLVENAKEAWKWFSVQAMALAGALQVTWVSLPPDMKVSIPPDAVYYLTLLLISSGIAGRVVKQGQKDAAE